MIDTIYSLSTSGMKAAIAIVRISGPATIAILQQLCGYSDFADRRATLRQIIDERGKRIDRALVIRFVAPHSFTGEDMAEFHVTGGRAVIAAVLRAIRACDGVRPAEAGEFARRAFENGKIDLAEVEGLAAIVDSETRAQLDHALAMATGELSRQCERVRNSLLKALADVETILDFSDIEDAQSMALSEVLPSLHEAAFVLEAILRGSGVSERLKEGLTVVIAGPPNVGKSTLLNYLARRDVAIVSPFAGTTRDVLEVQTELAGFPVVFIDTAGIRETKDPVEAEGVARAKLKGSIADLILWLSDDIGVMPPAEIVGRKVLAIRTKADLAAGNKQYGDLAISAKTGQGIDELVRLVADFASEHFRGFDQLSFGTERQRFAANEALMSLQEILQKPDRPTEIIADDLRSSAHALGRISGRIEVEEILGEIFSRLCVGK